jgi:hypothetical protein
MPKITQVMLKLLVILPESGIFYLKQFPVAATGVIHWTMEWINY